MMKDARQYGERAFAFLDILGFKDVIKQIDANPDLVVEVRKALVFALRVEEVNSKEIIEGWRQSKLEVIAFSDCIVISASKEELFSVVLKAKSIAGNMLAMGFLCRGGIAIGKGYHQDRIVFGQGFNDAHELEQSVAIYPRVVVSDAASKLLNEWSHTQEFIIPLLKLDVDGCWFVDLFRPPFPGAVGFEKVRFAEETKKTISKGIGHETPSIAAKYRWLANQYNVFVHDNDLDSSKLAIRLGV